MEKLSFPLILPTGKISFSIIFNPLINFQEINIYWKNFPFLQLNITYVQNHWRIYLFFSSGKTLHQFLEFYPQVKNTFSIFFFFLANLHFSIFQEKEKTETGLLLFLCRPKMARRPTAHARAALSRAVPRAQAATWAWAGNSAWRALPPGLKASPLDLSRPMGIDGCASISRS